MTSAFWTSYFFCKIMLEGWVCGLYTSVYGMCPWICIAIDVTLLGQNSAIHAINFLLMNEQHVGVRQLTSKPKWITYFYSSVQK